MHYGHVAFLAYGFAALSLHTGLAQSSGSTAQAQNPNGADSLHAIAEAKSRRLWAGLETSIAILHIDHVRRAIRESPRDDLLQSVDSGADHFGMQWGAFLRGHFEYRSGRAFRPKLGCGFNFIELRPVPSLRVEKNQENHGLPEFAHPPLEMSQMVKGLVPFAALDIDIFEVPGIRRVATCGIKVEGWTVRSYLHNDQQAVSDSANYQVVTHRLWLPQVTAGLMLDPLVHLTLGVGRGVVSLGIAGDWR